ncbi:MAG: 2'-5' RNA ligase family protein, partial [candidate division WOR-3 bacterium]
RGVKAAQFCVTAFPKLDNEAQFQRLREKYDPAQFRVRPHIPIILPFTPANLDEIQNVIDHVSTARRSLRPLAISFYKCVERGEYLFGIIEQGREEVVALHTRVAGAQPVPMLQDSPGYEPLLWLFRVPDQVRRSLALAEANRVGKTLGIIDALSLVRIEPDEEQKLVSVFPFGVGRVDYYDRFPI